MELDPHEIIETAQQGVGLEDAPANSARADRLNAVVAITVAVLATFMGICKVKDDNIVQAMQQAQADKIDHWGYYQARNLRQEVAAATVVQLELASLAAVPAAAPRYAQAIATYKAIASDQEQKKQALKDLAEHDQRTYDALNYRDDQFDLSDALIAVAIAMLAVTALTRLWALYVVSMLPTLAGVLMGCAGLVGLPWHPDALVRWLS